MSLEEIAPIITKIAYREALSVEEARRALNVIGREDEVLHGEQSEGFYHLALTFGLMAKGLNFEELYGLVLSLKDNMEPLDVGLAPDQVIDISGTGGDKVKTANVSTAASFVLAAAGLYVAKQATHAYTGSSGSADILRELGQDVFTQTDPRQLRRTLEDLGISGLYPPAFGHSFGNRLAFLNKLRMIGLLYPTPWHLVAWVPAPIPMAFRLYGVFESEYLEPIARIFVNLGYQSGLVVHGVEGLDEISTIGTTEVCEFREGEVGHFTITPEDLGLRRAALHEIQGGDRKANIESFFRVLAGVERGAKRDLVAANAGAALYIAGRASTLRCGVERALELLESGEAGTVLRRFMTYHGAESRWQEWMARIDA